MVTLLDHRGEPIKREQLSEPQTAKIASLHQEFASHPTRGLTPGRLASILEQAEQGNLVAQNELFEDMEEKDGHIHAELGKRKRVLLGLDWVIKPPRNATPQEEKAAELAQEIIRDISNFEDVILDMADGIGKGYSMLEFDGWERIENTWQPRDILHRPATWFTVDRATHSNLQLRTQSGEGEELNAFGWITHVHKSKSGYITRAGLHRVLAWPFLFKNYSVRDLAEFLEIYGLPMRLGEYPSGASDDEKATLLRAVVNIGHAAAGIIPQGMAIDFKEAAQGSKDPYEAMIDWCERTQSKAILGGTLTSTAESTGLGSNTADVHNEVRHDLMKSDAAQIASTLTRDLVYPILMLNGKIDSLRRCPRFEFDTYEAEDLKLYADAMPKLVSIGMRIPVDHVHKKLRIPLAEKDEEVLQTAQPALQGNEALAGHAGCKHCNTAALNATQQQKDVADHYTDRLEDKSEAALNALIEPIRRLVMNAGSMAEIMESLLDIYGDMDDAALSTIIRDALTAAELAGRFEINEGKIDV